MAMPGIPGAFVFMADQWEPEDLSSSGLVSELPAWIFSFGAVTTLLAVILE